MQGGHWKGKPLQHDAGRQKAWCAEKDCFRTLNDRPFYWSSWSFAGWASSCTSSHRSRVCEEATVREEVCKVPEHFDRESWAYDLVDLVNGCFATRVGGRAFQHSMTWRRVCRPEEDPHHPLNLWQTFTVRDFQNIPLQLHVWCFFVVRACCQVVADDRLSEATLVCPAAEGTTGRPVSIQRPKAACHPTIMSSEESLACICMLLTLCNIYDMHG